MSSTDTLIVVAILLLLAFLIWSRIMQQTMLETFREIKSMIKESQEEK